MARYSAGHKEATREKLVELAARHIRMHGMASLGVASLMAEAGMTHGGFYAHFKSREALLAAAVERVFDQSVEALAYWPKKYGEGALSKYKDFYFSSRHRDDASAGCPVPSLAGEARLASPEVKAAFDAGLERLADAIARMTPEGETAAGRKAALCLLGEMAGVLALSRVVDAKRSGEVLAAGRKAVAV